MIIHRPAHTRGNPFTDWITSFRTFSFAGYFNPKYRNFSHLRTINDDRVQPGGHVPEHEHKNMEIFGYVVEGVCRHTDSHGKILDIPAGAVQRMSTGSGISHTEGNASDKPNRYMQLWIEPNVLEITPGYEQKTIPLEDKQGKLCLVASPDGENHSVKIHADAKIYAGLFNGNQSAILAINPKLKAYVHLIKGSLNVNGNSLSTGDALLIEGETKIQIKDGGNAEVLVFELTA